MTPFEKVLDVLDDHTVVWHSESKEYQCDCGLKFMDGWDYQPHQAALIVQALGL